MNYLKKGAVLPLVMGIILAVTILLASLLNMPGGIRENAHRHLLELQKIYDAESSLLLNLQNLPYNFLENPPWNLRFPKVLQNKQSPWADFYAVANDDKEIHVLASYLCDSSCYLLRSLENRKRIFDGFKESIINEISMAKPPLNLQIKSGNRRIIGRANSMSLWIQDGDLSLDLTGDVSSMRFKVEGNGELRGNATIDTLRIYTQGNLTIRGYIKVKWLEAFSDGELKIKNPAEISGVAVAKQRILFEKKVKVNSPIFLMSLYNHEFLLKSMNVPDFLEAPLTPFEWSLK